eukprot:GHRR01022758.1.p1 GENE.GHRR01022758.1~~GHRR01022758.1.p1  ORF type:complete len:274 (+),score=28.23 GHRR01022758.1:404-1225(+)
MFHLLTWLSRNCPSRWFASSPCGDCCDCLHLLPSRLSVLDNLWMGHHEIFCTYSCGKWLRCLLVLVSLGQAYHQVSCSCCIRPCQVALHAMISYCPKRFTACSGAYCCCILFFLVPLQIKEENPRLARDSKVLRVTMDNVYEVFTSPRDTTGLQGIHFRFMPDMVQVKHALQVSFGCCDATLTPASPDPECNVIIGHCMCDILHSRLLVSSFLQARPYSNPTMHPCIHGVASVISDCLYVLGLQAHRQAAAGNAALMHAGACHTPICVWHSWH